MSTWLVFCDLELDSGTEFLSGGPVAHPTRTYSARVLSFGYLDRSIPVPSGPPQISDAKIRLADTDRYIRDTLATQTPRRRLAKLKLVQEGASTASSPWFFVGYIVDFDAGSGYCDLSLRDQSFAWLDEIIPSIGTRENFPELAEGVDSFFFPIITGIVVSPELSPMVNKQGVIPLPHIAYDAGIGDRWAVACHPIFDLVAVYRKLPDEGIFTVVDPSEFNVTLEARTIEGVDYNLTFLDFLAEQVAGTEIRADVQGIDFRGGWNGIAAIGYDISTSPPTGTPVVLRNPIDFFINMTFLVLAKAGVAADFDGTRIAAVRTLFETLEYKCDGVILESMTCRSFLGRFLSDFNLDMFATVDGKIALNFTDTTDAGRPVFTDKSHVLRGTYRERLANPTANQCRYAYAKNYATDQWASQKIYNHTADQAVLGKLETDTLELWFVRDDATADDAVLRRMAFQAIGSYRQEFTLPLPEVVTDLELAALVGITHREGFDAGGYTNKEVKVTGLTADLDKLTVTVRSILRVPQTMAIPDTSPETSPETSPTESVSDNFNRADSSSLGANWLEFGDYDITIDANRASLTGNNTFALYVGGASWVDQRVTFEYITRATDGAQECGPAGRMSGTTVANARCYACTIGKDGSGHFVKLWRRDVNSSVVLATSAAYALLPNDIVVLEIAGAGATVSLTGKVNGVTKVTYSDTDGNRITGAGKGGMATMLTDGTTTQKWDNWSAEEL